jgi:hypothetical protein
MGRAFTKGDRVFHLDEADREGGAFYAEAIVYSCGNKRMVLTCADTGRELGRNYAPAVAEFGTVGTIPATTIEQRDAHGLEISRRLIARAHAGVEGSRERLAERGSPCAFKAELIDIDASEIIAAPRLDLLDVYVSELPAKRARVKALRDAVRARNS